MPKDSLTWDEFLKRMEGFDDKERRVIEKRLETNYRREPLEFLTASEADLLGLILDRLILQDDNEDKIDLVGFMDWAIPNPLGFGDRQENLPGEPTLFREGFKGIDETSQYMFAGRKFADLTETEKDRVISAIQEGKPEGDTWNNISSTIFFKKLMQKAIAGYCAHPKTWVRIGFYGPAYPEGYIWISRREVKARHDKKPGYLTF
ncbi:MAG: gluconate 2-dehydrogenase subunit 3 family protein [Armatimonadota bacterium]